MWVDINVLEEISSQNKLKPQLGLYLREGFLKT